MDKQGQEKQPQNPPYSDICEKVETFIQHIRNFDYIVDTKDEMSDMLAISMTKYEAEKMAKPFDKWVNAYTCLTFINRAFAHGIVKQGEGLANKLKECSEQNIELAKDLEETTKELKDAKEKIKELEQMLPHYEGVLE